MDKKKIIIVAAIAAVVTFLALVVVGGIGGIYYLGVVKPFNDTKVAINAGDVDTVVDLYDSLKRDSDREFVKNEMLKYFENSVMDFKYERISYDDVESRYRKLSKKILNGNEKAETLMGEAEVLNESKENFRKAKECSEQEDYLTAIEHYEKVCEEDPNYEAAQKAIEECNKLQEEVMAEQAAESITGEWVAYLDLGDYIERSANLKEDIEFKMGLLFTFDNSGKCIIGVDRDSIIEACKANSNVLEDFFYELAAEDGYDRATVDLMVAMSGYGSVAEVVGESIYTKMMEGFGNGQGYMMDYSVEGTKVWISNNGYGITGEFVYDQSVSDYVISFDENGNGKIFAAFETFDVEPPWIFYRK